MNRRLVWVVMSVALAAGGRPARADVVVLTNGREYRGVIVEETADVVRLRRASGGITGFARAQIARLVRESEEVNRQYEPEAAAPAARGLPPSELRRAVDGWLAAAPEARGALLEKLRGARGAALAEVETRLDALWERADGRVDPAVPARAAAPLTAELARRRAELLGLINDGVRYPDDKTPPYRETQRRLDELETELRAWLEERASPEGLLARAPVFTTATAAEAPLVELRAALGTRAQADRRRRAFLARHAPALAPHVPRAPQPADLPLLAADLPLGPEERESINLVNEYRMLLGLHPLIAEARLARAARKHSEDMAARGFFDHVNPEGERPGDRVKKEGYVFRGCGENIAMNPGGPSGAFRAWLHSPPHHRNIVKESYLELGVGTSGKHYTQVFGTPPGAAAPGPFVPAGRQAAPLPGAGGGPGDAPAGGGARPSAAVRPEPQAPTTPGPVGNPDPAPGRQWQKPGGSLRDALRDQPAPPAPAPPED